MKDIEKLIIQNNSIIEKKKFKKKSQEIKIGKVI